MQNVSRRAFLKHAGMGALLTSAECTTPLSRRQAATVNTDVTIEPLQKKEFTDPVTGRTVWQITDSKLESKHSYYDLCPWSHDGAYLVFSSVAPATLRQGPKGPYGSALTSDDAVVRIVDTTDYKIRIVARNASYNSHTGAFALWQPRHRTVYYKRSDGEVGVVEIDTGKAGVFSGGMRQFSPDGSTIVYLRNSGKAARKQYDTKRVPDDTVFVAATEGSGPRQVVTTQQLYALTPNRDQFELDDMTIGNTKWRCDGQYILLANFIHPKPKVRRSLYVVTQDGSEARWLCHFGHHHSWSPDGTSILFNDWKAGSGYRIHLIDFNGTNRRLVTDAIEGSHPAMSADGKRIVDFDHKGIFLVHVDQQSVERLSVYRKPFPMDIAGTHPHVVWNHDGTQVLYNSAETGHSELYMIPCVT